MVPSPDTAEKLHQFFPKISTEWVSTLSLPPAGEELAQLHERMGAVISVIVSRVGEGKIGRSHRGENNGAQLSGAEIVMENIATPRHSRILLVGHVAPLIALIRMLVGQIELPLRIGCASISIMKRKIDSSVDERERPEEDGAARLGAYEATISNGHLSDGDWKPWGFMNL